MSASVKTQNNWVPVETHHQSLCESRVCAQIITPTALLSGPLTLPACHYWPALNLDIQQEDYQLKLKCITFQEDQLMNHLSK